MRRELRSNDVLLFIGTDGILYETIICLTSNGITRATSTIESSTKCGASSTPGTKTQSISFEGVIMLDPDAGEASVVQLVDYYDNDTTIYFKMGPADPGIGIGGYTYYGTGFISTLDETFAVDAAATFSGTISPDGPVSITTATS